MIYLGSDHRGFNLKNILVSKLIEAGFEVSDLGDNELDKDDDYVDFAVKVAEAVQQDNKSWGVVICGSGVGVDMVANRFKGIRSALVFDVQRSIQSRQHEDANVLALAADVLDETTAWEIVEAFLKTPFSNEERHVRRLNKMASLER